MKAYFNSQDIKYKNPFGACETGTEVTFHIETSEVDGVVLRTWSDKDGEGKIEMQRDGDFFGCTVKMPEEPGLFWYFFLIYSGNEVYCYGNNEAELGGEGRLTKEQPGSFQITVYKPTKTPDWFKHAIVYYIFPDRFCKGSDFEKRKANATRPDDWKGPGMFFEEDWYKRPSYEKNEDGTISRWQFYGGTLEGIIEKLPYIKSLGADAIYLCPIFKASSNHRYDTADYKQIDPLLGDDEAFKKLCEKAEDYRISIILDGVFSHTGCDSIYFDRFGNFNQGGAFDNPESEYYPWYTFYEDGTYNSWWGDPNLPNVTEETPSYREFICGKDGVLNKWLGLGAKGWRLDVADELPGSFIKEIRRTIKSGPSGEDAVLIGEVWEDASHKVSYDEMREYLLGDELDGTMNYPFRRYIIRYLMKRYSSEEFCARVMSLVENYPKENLFCMINMLGSHDRTRPLTKFSLNANIAEELQPDFELKGIEYDLAKMRMKLATVLQYTLPGVPVIYYGDEAGLQGFTDPYNRAAYPWGKEDEDLILHYRKLGLIYKQHTSLHTGNFRCYSMGEDVVAIERQDDLERVTVLVNRNWQNPVVVAVDTADYDSAIDVYNGEEIETAGRNHLISVPPAGARIIVMTD